MEGMLHFMSTKYAIAFRRSSHSYTFMRVVAAIMTSAKYQELSSCPPLKKEETTIIIIKNIKREFQFKRDGYTKSYFGGFKA